MKSPSRTTVGSRSRAPSTRSSSSSRAMVPIVDVSRGSAVRRAASAAWPAPPAITRERVLNITSILRVDLLQLGLGPQDGILGLHALNGLGVHVGDDVLRLDLGRGAAGRSRVPVEAERAGRGAVGQHHRVDFPHLVLLPVGRRSDAESLLGDEPLLELLLAV